MRLRMPQTQRNTRPGSRVNFEEDASSVQEDLTVFEDKIGCKDNRIGPKSKYPNIELKREFNAKNFRDSNRHITRLASTRAGTMRSYVQTNQAGRKRGMAEQNHRSSTRKECYDEEQMDDQNDDEIDESESHY